MSVGDYDVKFIFDYCYIGVAVFAEDEAEAESNARLQLVESGVQLHEEPSEIEITLQGVFV